MRRSSVIGYVVVLSLIVACAICLLTHSLMNVRRIQRAIDCTDNMRALRRGCKMYASDHDGRFPDTLAEIFDYVDLKHFFCACDYRGHLPKDMKTFEKVSVSYVIMPGLSESDDPDTILVYEKSILNHGGKYVCPIDGHVGKISVDKIVEEDFDEIARGLSSFFVDKERYPTNEEGLEILITSGYLKSLPVDPFDREGKRLYGYATKNVNNDWILTCYGPDEDRDINLALYTQGRLSAKGLLRRKTKLVLGMMTIKRTNGDMFRTGP